MVKCFEIDIVEVVECFELDVGGFRVNPQRSLALLHTSLNIPTGPGTLVHIEGFTLDTIHKM